MLRPAVASASRATRAPLLSRAKSSKAKAVVAAPAPQSDWTPPEIHLGQTHPSRYGEYYNSTLSSDLLYMTYNHRTATKVEHEAATTAAPAQVAKTGYEANRPEKGPRGSNSVRPLTKGVSPSNLIRLESITVHTMVKEAIGNKHHLLSAIMALRAISGETVNGGGRTGSSGVQVLSASNGAAAWKLRAGMPVSTKVELRGEAMYDFVQSLVDFVLPRIRDFPGVVLPGPSESKRAPHVTAGVVSFGLPAIAMGLFPQIEANIDHYPKLHGFHMHFKTNARGQDAQEYTRALLSGFRIPFYRK